MKHSISNLSIKSKCCESLKNYERRLRIQNPLRAIIKMSKALMIFLNHQNRALSNPTNNQTFLLQNNQTNPNQNPHQTPPLSSQLQNKRHLKKNMKRISIRIKTLEFRRSQGVSMMKYLTKLKNLTRIRSKSIIWLTGYLQQRTNMM